MTCMHDVTQQSTYLAALSTSLGAVVIKFPEATSSIPTVGVQPYLLTRSLFPIEVFFKCPTIQTDLSSWGVPVALQLNFVGF